MSDVKLEFLTLCDFAMTSSEGKLSIVGIFDRMFVSQTPAKFSRFFTVAILSGKPNSEAKISFTIQIPSKKELPGPKEMIIKFGSGGRTNLITDVANFPLPEIGEYKLFILANGKSLGSNSFFVSKTSTPSNKKTVN